MSYDKIKNIAIKKDCVTITSADSSIYPTTYETYQSKWGTELIKNGKKAELIGSICYDFLCGNYHSTNDKANRKFLYALTINRDELNRMMTMLWDDYDWETKTHKYTPEQKEQIKAQLIEQLYKNYLVAEQVDKENVGKEFVIELNCGYFYNKSKYGFRYAFWKGKAKRMDYLSATNIIHNGTIDSKYEPSIVAA